MEQNPNRASTILKPTGPPYASGSVYLGFNGHNVSGALYTPSVTYPDAGWSFVHGPGTDDPLIGYHRQLGGERILYFVTDGQGRVLAVADSSGYRSPADNSNSGIVRWRLAGGSVSGSSFNADRMSGGDVPGLSFYRNRAYDQTTGRWTQEDPLGVAGGLNLYQFNGNNPVSNSDPFGLCPDGNAICPLIEFTTTVLGGIGGFIAGGGTGAAIAGATGGAGLAAIPALAVEGAAGGAVGGLGLGKAITNVMFATGESKQIGDAITKAAGKKANTSSSRRDVGRFLEEEKAAGRGGTKNKRGDFKFGELVDKVKEFLGGD